MATRNNLKKLAGLKKLSVRDLATEYAKLTGRRVTTNRKADLLALFANEMCHNRPAKFKTCR